jgi:hypothetical protein
VSTRPDFDLALPGSWWSIPLDDEPTALRAIRRLVAEVAGRSDDQARLRDELRRRFAAVAQQAMAAEAKQLHLCREIVPGVPLPSSLTVYWPPLVLPPGPQGAAGLRSLIGEPEQGQAEEEFAVAGTVGIRRDRLVVSPGGEGQGDPEVTTVEVGYWLVLPGGSRVVLLSFSCGMPMLRTELVALFDLVVATVRWS